MYNRPSIHRSLGFSLIELMMTVAILSMLATMGSLEYQQMLIHSKYGRAKGELSGVISVIEGERVADGENLFQILGHNCTMCDMGCGVGGPLVCSSPAVGASDWKILGFDSPPKDPWGDYYLLDANEGEFGPTDCRHDAVYTAGEDQSFNGGGTGDSVLPDDMVFRVPFYSVVCNPGPTEGPITNILIEGGL